MTDIEQQNLTAELIKAEAYRVKSEFQRAWEDSLKFKAQSFAHIPQAAIAYEMAWHGFKAGKASNGR